MTVEKNICGLQFEFIKAFNFVNVAILIL